MLYDSKANQSKSSTSDTSTSVYESAAQSQAGRSTGEDSQPPPIAAPSYAEAAASGLGGAAQAKQPAAIPNAQASAAPQAAVVAQAPVQQQAPSAGGGFGPDLEQRSVQYHNGQVQSSNSYNQRAFKRFFVAFAWAILAWFAMLMVAGGATEMMVHDVRQALLELWRTGMLVADM